MPANRGNRTQYSQPRFALDPQEDTRMSAVAHEPQPMLEAESPRLLSLVVSDDLHSRL